MYKPSTLLRRFPCRRWLLLAHQVWARKYHIHRSSSCRFLRFPNSCVDAHFCRLLLRLHETKYTTLPASIGDTNNYWCRYKCSKWNHSFMFIHSCRLIQATGPIEQREKHKHTQTHIAITHSKHTEENNERKNNNKNNNNNTATHRTSFVIFAVSAMGRWGQSPYGQSVWG